MMAFDEADRTIRGYEVKRGNGQFDAGKIRSIKRDLMCVQVLLTGILQWMIEGTMLWQEHGLNPPKAVTDTFTLSYSAE